MSSFRQIEANRRNARLSTGPKTEHGKRRSRRNAVRHGLAAETVINNLEDADDYAAFELAVTSAYEATTAVERELVLRLASLLWRLRRATAIESGLFEIQAQHLLCFRQQPQEGRRQSTDNVYRFATACWNGNEPDKELSNNHSDRQNSNPSVAAQSDDLTGSFVRLVNLPSYPLDRLSRYESTLWRQTCQILLALRCLDLRKR
jgi:hypothetical protein